MIQDSTTSVDINAVDCDGMTVLDWMICWTHFLDKDLTKEAVTYLKGSYNLKEINRNFSLGLGAVQKTGTYTYCTRCSVRFEIQSNPMTCKNHVGKLVPIEDDFGVYAHEWDCCRKSNYGCQPSRHSLSALSEQT
jgi:hypothetical protein